MPASHLIHPSLAYAHVTLEGHVTLPQILTDYMAYTTDKDFRTGQAMFIDASKVTKYGVTFRGLLAILKHQIGVLDPFGPSILTSIYAPSDLMFEKAKEHQRLTSGSGINCVGVFRRETDAWAFLGLEEDA